MYKEDIHGILLFDKPAGISSNRILQKIKKIFCAKKAGYIGTLDPLATGLLPICFGEGARLAEQLNNSIKCYYTTAKLGETTTTYDIEGTILQERKVNFSHVDLLKSLKLLKKKKNQVIPNYSAVKYKGRPLYKYARNNISIPEITRNIKIYKLDCIKYNDKFIKLKILCSKGTYIRRIIHDLGKLLRCGAHVVSLRRIRISSYKVSDAISINQLYDFIQKYPINIKYDILNKFLIPIKTLFFLLPKIVCSDYYAIHSIRKKRIFLNIHTSQMFRIMIQNNNAIFIIGRTNEIGKFISYKILNIK